MAVVLTACALIAAATGGGSAGAPPGLERGVPVLLLYIGPDMLLPFTSALGAVAGVLMIFWQRIVAIARRLWRLLLRRPT